MTKSFKTSIAFVCSMAISLAFVPCLSAQTADSQRHTAKVLSDGTIENGGGTGGWISFVSHPSTGSYIVNFATPFTVAPNCVVTTDSVSGSPFANVGIIG